MNTRTTNYVDNLKTIKMALDTIKIPYWLEYGTLLAAYRDGKPMAYDICDIDIGVKFEDFTPELDAKITIFMKSQGFQCNTPPITPWTYQRFYSKNEGHVDIWLFHKTKDNFYHKAWFLTPGRYEHIVVPTKYYDGINTKITYCNMEFLIPNMTDNYLTLIYGANWKTPIPMVPYRNKHIDNSNRVYRRFVDYLHGRWNEVEYLKENF